MDFVKKEWQFRDIISENELNRMEDGIEEGITKAEQAQQTATDAQTNLDNHVSATTGVHGATSAATPNTLVQRDPAGRFKAAAPSDPDDVARKAEVDERAPLSGAVFTGPVEYSSNPRESNDLNNEINPGWVVFTPNTANRPDISGFSNYGVVRIERRNSNRVAQTAYGLTGNNDAKIVVRVLGDNGWSQWYKVWNESNDGAGSGLDADLLDGIEGNRFIYGDNSTGTQVYGGDLNAVTKSGFYHSATGHSNSPTGGNGFFIHVQHPNSSNQSLQFYQYSSNQLYWRRKLDNNWGNWFGIWHSGNVPIETGSWTPELRFGGSTAGITYAVRIGRYTRIANVVYWSFRITLTSKGSASGAAVIAGLPFVRESSLEYDHCIGRTINIAVPSGRWLVGYVSSTSSIYLFTNDGSPLTSAEFANNSEIRASGFYFI